MSHNQRNSRLLFSVVVRGSPWTLFPLVEEPSHTANVCSESKVDAGVLSQSWRELPAMMGVGGVRDGHGEKVQESLKQVHYDYKNLLGGMMRKFSWMLLVLTVSLWAVEG